MKIAVLESCVFFYLIKVKQSDDPCVAGPVEDKQRTFLFV